VKIVSKGAQLNHWEKAFTNIAGLPDNNREESGQMMCGVKLKDRIPSKELRERLRLGDIISVLQQSRLRWYGHVLRKEDNDWVKKCIEYEVEGARPGGRPKKTWTEIVQKDCQARKLNSQHATDRNRWRKQSSR